jgi:hypothetical protein
MVSARPPQAETKTAPSAHANTLTMTERYHGTPRGVDTGPALLSVGQAEAEREER